MNSNTKTTDRQSRAYEQASEYLVLPLNPGANDWEVSKISTGTRYVVDLDRKSCTCPDHARRGVACKHLHLAAFHAEAETPREERASFATVNAEANTAAREAAQRAQAYADRALWD